MLEVDAQLHRFAATILGRTSLSYDRNAATKLENDKIDAQVHHLCICLIPHFLTQAATAVLEYLVRKFRCALRCPIATPVSHRRDHAFCVQAVRSALPSAIGHISAGVSVTCMQDTRSQRRQSACMLCTVSCNSRVRSAGSGQRHRGHRVSISRGHKANRGRHSQNRHRKALLEGPCAAPLPHPPVQQTRMPCPDMIYSRMPCPDVHLTRAQHPAQADAAQPALACSCGGSAALCRSRARRCINADARSCGQTLRRSGVGAC